MRRIVKESWERCFEYGLDPMRLPMQVLDGERLLQAQNANRTLMSQAEPILQTVHEALLDQPHVVALLEPNGLVLRLFGDPVSTELGKEANLFEGASWHERDCGCNGGGTALACGQPVVLIGPEHFMADYAPWTCVGVPLRGAHGELIGSVDLSGPNDQITVQTWGWALSIGQAIEASMRSGGPEPGAASQEVARQPDHPLNALRGALHLLSRQGELLPTHLQLLSQTIQALTPTEGSLLDGNRLHEPTRTDEASKLALFLAALEYLADGFLAVDLHGRVLASNAQARHWLGGIPLHPGISVLDLPLPDEVKQALTQFGLVDTFRPEMVAFHLPVGQTDAHIVPLVGVGTVAVLHDRTHERRTRRMQEDLIANASHELRGPIAAVSALMEALRDGLIPAADRDRYIEGVLRVLDRMKQVISAVIDLARLQGETERPQMQACQLALVFANLQRRWKDRFAKKQVHLDVTMPGVTITASPELLLNCLDQLMDNALQFTPPGKTVQLAATLHRSDVRITVSDTGPGISPEELSCIPEPFYKVDRARTLHQSSGAGLGLSICRRMAELMRGRIELQSELEKGSAFSIVLPAGLPGFGDEKMPQ